jgi:hypothetical protein
MYLVFSVFASRATSLLASIKVSVFFFMVYNVKFEVLTTVTMKSAIFWDVTPCILVDVYQKF